MSQIDNIEDIAFSTAFQIDKAIGAPTGTINSPAPGVGSFSLTSETVETGFGESCYFKGIYSIDSGATWNDFGAMIPNVSTPSMPVFQTVDVVGAVEPDGGLRVTVINYYDNVHSVATAYTVLWKVVLFSKNNQGSITPIDIPNPIAFTTLERDYQKIAFQDEIPYNISSGVGKTETITHNLGYIPKVRSFYQATDGTQLMIDPWLAFRIETRITTTTVSFVLQGGTYSTNTRTGFIEYRIYFKDSN